jgi:uncharacterized membrane protein YgcG
VKRRRKDSGFALLLVFLMAAVIAITLYTEIPRVAFESQRQKEQLLIERGEQYKRAIVVFFRDNKRYPGKIEDLENTNTRRYLRHRYKDPMTGKDEWRVIHVQNGVLTDLANSKQKPGDDKKTDSTAGQYVGEQAGIGQAPVPGSATAQFNAALRRRASESGGGVPGIGPDGQPVQVATTGVTVVPPGAQGATGLPGQPPYPVQPGQYPIGPNGQPMTPGQLVQPTNPNQAYNPNQPYPGQVQPGLPPGQFPGAAPGVFRPGVPGQLGQPTQPPQSSSGSYVGGGGSYVGGGGSYVGGGTYVGGGSPVGSQPNAPGAVAGYPGQPQQPIQPGAFPGVPGMPVNSQTGGVSAQPYPTAPGSQGAPPQFGQPGTTTGQPNAAADMIRQILTSPRPGGLQGLQQAAAGGQALGSGMAGVASTSEAESIMIYNDHQAYNEWEFIFDYTKDSKLPADPRQGTVGTPANQMPGTSNQQQQPSPFGGNPMNSPAPTGLPRIGRQ